MLIFTHECIEMHDPNGDEAFSRLYETYLSKAILEKKDLYESIFLKIAAKIQKIIAQNTKLEREIFSFFTIIGNEFPEYDRFDLFLKAGFNVHAAATFHKLFFDFLIIKAQVEPYQSRSCDTLFMQTLAYIAKNQMLLSRLRKQLKSSHIFPDHKIGRKLLPESTIVATSKFGIMSENRTPPALKFYFPLSYYSGQNRYIKEENSQAVQWLTANRLPFIAGISSTVGTCFCGIIQLDTLSLSDIKTYLMVLVASLVSRGYHSFGETHLILKRLGFNMKELRTLDVNSYYRQFLTPEFINSDNYRNFLATVHMQEPNHTSKPHGF